MVESNQLAQLLLPTESQRLALLGVLLGFLCEACSQRRRKEC
jgi:hypothetical protein